MKSTPILTLLLTLVLGLTVTLLMTESCKKKEDCAAIDCNTGTQNPSTCECDCPTGFSGINCETEDKCITGNVNCQNGGICVDGTCDCPDGTLGANCQTFDPKKVQILLNGGRTPLELFDGGIPLDSLYGKMHGGGLLIDLNTSNGNVLIAASEDQTNSVKWGGNGTDITAITNIATIPDAGMDLNGETNTAAIVAQLGTNGGADYAAKLCADLAVNGFDDWYLPAEGELDQMYKKLGNGGSGQIANGFYWSSTERSATAGWYVAFTSGSLNTFTKDGNYRCRCVRK